MFSNSSGGGCNCGCSGKVLHPDEFSKVVAAPGTPEALTAALTTFRSATLVANKAARTVNTGTVYLWSTSGNDTQPFPILPGKIAEIVAPGGFKFDFQDFYLDVDNAGDGVQVVFA